ncbi:uncharacterized protein L203_103707 [Cryptococcus depauperatus CBS 7841]|uniref:ubiquitinyl hydrolase 1 n=1 Tax=Cryptococcus depauperatus CBS 7841 TaxID=1295531 RepID=A0A1E3IH06_9TREE|nr:ubiquitin carboxyl-terminal hydrolase Ubp16 [Cryptococcus depauperatus CBS 7841]
MATTATATPFLFQSSLHDPGLLQEMLSNPLKFGPPVAMRGMNFVGGTKEVVLELESPKAVKKQFEKEADDDNETKASSMLSPKKVKTAINGEDKRDKELQAVASKIPLDQSAPRTLPANSLGLHSITFDLTWPEPMVKAKCAAGLYNPSMACYSNATLQVLLHTPPVLRIALAHDEGSCIQRQKKNFCMLCTLKNMAESFHWSGKRAYSPEVHRSLSQIKKGFNKNRQEDTHEFFRFVTDALQNTATARLPKNASEKVKHASWVYCLWGGRIRSRVVCSRCNNPSDKFDSFLDLSLDVNRQGKKSIKNMMLGFTKEDRLEGDNKYHCDRCKGKSNATKSFKIEQAPPILTLHLKRFSVNYNAYNGRARADKFNQFIEFEEKLDIAPYMVNPNMPGTKYRLFGVTCHRGTELRFGHYTSYVRGPSGQWFHADDEEMSPVKLDQVLSDKTAYLLSYMRVKDDRDGSGALLEARANYVVNELKSESDEEKKAQSLAKRKRTYDPDGQSRMTVNIVKARTPPLPSPTSSASGRLSTDSPDPAMPPSLPPQFIFTPQSKPSSSVISHSESVNASSFYSSPNTRTANPLAGMSKKERKKFKQKEKGKARPSSAPMPFSQGRKGLAKNRQPGVLSRMKGKA